MISGSQATDGPSQGTPLGTRPMMGLDKWFNKEPLHKWEDQRVPLQFMPEAGCYSWTLLSGNDQRLFFVDQFEVQWFPFRDPVCAQKCMVLRPLFRSLRVPCKSTPQIWKGAAFGLKKRMRCWWATSFSLFEGCRLQPPTQFAECVNPKGEPILQTQHLEAIAKLNLGCGHC